MPRVGQRKVECAGLAPCTERRGHLQQANTVICTEAADDFGGVVRTPIVDQEELDFVGRVFQPLQGANSVRDDTPFIVTGHQHGQAGQLGIRNLRHIPRSLASPPVINVPEEKEY